MKLKPFALLFLIVGSALGVAVVAAPAHPVPAVGPATPESCIAVPDAASADFTPAVADLAASPSATFQSGAVPTAKIQFCKQKYPCTTRGAICNDMGCTCQTYQGTLRCAR